MGQFTLDLTRIVNKYKARMDVVVQKVTLDIFSSIIFKSPVDTGRFRGGWIATVGNYSRDLTDILDRNGSIAFANMSGLVSRTAAGNVVYMVNNLPYSIRLEYGYSKQAPLGMVRTTITEFQDYVSKAARGFR